MPIPNPLFHSSKKNPDITREEKGVQKSIKDCAKREDLRSMRVLAKEIVSSRKTVARLHENKAQMNSVSMMLTEQLATVRSVGHLEKSTEVLSAMNLLTRNAAVRDSRVDRRDVVTQKVSWGFPAKRIKIMLILASDRNLHLCVLVRHGSYVERCGGYGAHHRSDLRPVS